MDSIMQVRRISGKDARIAKRKQDDSGQNENFSLPIFCILFFFQIQCIVYFVNGPNHCADTQSVSSMSTLPAIVLPNSPPTWSALPSMDYYEFQVPHASAEFDQIAGYMTNTIASYHIRSPSNHKVQFASLESAYSLLQ